MHSSSNSIKIYRGTIMKFSIKLEVTREELTTVKRMFEDQYQAMADSANIGKYFTSEQADDIIADMFKAVEFKMSSSSPFHNAAYLLHLKKTVIIDVEVSLSRQHIEILTEVMNLFFNTGLPIVDALFGAVAAIKGEELIASMKVLALRFKELTKDSVYTESKAEGDAVEAL